MKKGYKLCPYCKEQIKEDAIKCRYCKSDLSKKEVQKNEQTWKTIVLGIIFLLYGIINTFLALFGVTTFYNSLNLGEIGNVLILIFGVIFIAVSIGYFSRKRWVISWGYGTSILNLVVGLFTLNLVLIIIWGFAFYLVCTSEKEFPKKESSEEEKSLWGEEDKDYEMKELSEDEKIN